MMCLPPFALWTATDRSRRGIDGAPPAHSRTNGRLRVRLMKSFSQRWRERGGRIAHIILPFDDIMEIALALLALSPTELEALGWSFADRKRLLDHFLASGKAAQRTDREALGRTPLDLHLPLRDIRHLQAFVRRDLPKAATKAAVVERLAAVLDSVR